MKLVLYDDSTQPRRHRYLRGILKEDAVVSIESVVGHLAASSPQQLMEAVINNFDALRPELERRAESGPSLPLSGVRLRPPLPRPSKILACIGNYWEHMQREPRPLNMFLKSPDAVIGPGDTVVLPDFQGIEVFHHEAELGIVIKGPAKGVSQRRHASAIFGYTCFIDVSARGEGRRTWRAGSWMGKSFDTFAPLGPCIVTADEVPEPNKLAVKLWNNGDLRHDYNTSDMEHSVPELVAFATSIMTLNTGDVISCGTNHEGLGPLQDGELVEIEIQGIGRMAVHVSDPLKRSWDRGVYMGPGSTNPGAQAAQGG